MAFPCLCTLYVTPYFVHRGTDALRAVLLALRSTFPVIANKENMKRTKKYPVDIQC